LPIARIKRGRFWYLRGTVAGQRIYESTHTGDSKAAEIVRIKRESELLERHVYGRAAVTTFAEAALIYMQAGGEARYLGPIIAHFGPRKRLHEIDNEAATACAVALYPSAAPATINRQVITPISAVVTMAALDGLCPARQFRRRPEKNARIDWLTPEQAETAFSAATPRGRRFLAFFLGTGCRVNEALRLTRANLHLATSEAWLVEAKNDRPRMVRYPSRTRAIFDGDWMPEAGTVFLTPKGKPYRLRDETGQALGGQLKGEFDQIREAADLPLLTPHLLRHTWATWYYAQTRDFGGLMDFGGWEKADMANRYRKIAPSDLAARLAAHGWHFGAEFVQPITGTSEITHQFKVIG
jgi:integrase